MNPAPPTAPRNPPTGRRNPDTGKLEGMNWNDPDTIAWASRKQQRHDFDEQRAIRNARRRERKSRRIRTRQSRIANRSR